MKKILIGLDPGCTLVKGEDKNRASHAGRLRVYMAQGKHRYIERLGQPCLTVARANGTPIENFDEEVDMLEVEAIWLGLVEPGFGPHVL